MATTGLWAVKSRLDRLVDYVSDPLKTVTEYVIDDEKTIQKRYVSCINCSFDDPRKSMENTKKLFQDQSKILAFHGFQSFEKGEVDPDTAHKIGVEFAQKMWGERFEVIVTTHLNTDNIHNHFLLNSTSFVDGKRYCNTYKDLQRMRNLSDDFCKEYGLSVIEDKKYNGRSRASYYQDKTLRAMIKEDVDQAIHVSYTDRQFYNELRFLGYEIKVTEQNIAVKHPMAKRFIRLKSLGKNYSYDALIDRILDMEKVYVRPYAIYEDQGFNIKPYVEKYRRGFLVGLLEIFLGYQIQLKVIPRTNRTRLSKEDQEEYVRALKKLHSLSKQTILLCENQIETIDQLHSYQKMIQNQLQVLLNLRQKYRNKIRYAKEDEDKQDYNNKAKELTPEIGKLREKITLCSEIEKRSLSMERYLNNRESRGRRQYETRL